jgi:peptide/nickel transport system permease protein
VIPFNPEVIDANGVAEGDTEMQRQDRLLIPRPLRYVLRTAVQSVGVVFAVVSATFILIRLVPGDPARQILGVQAPQSAVDALRDKLNLNAPLYSQYVHFVGGALHGNFGTSLGFPGESVTSIVVSGLRTTLTLVAFTMLLSVLLGIPIGLWAAATTWRFTDGAIRVTSMTFLATPAPFAGLLLILIFPLHLHIGTAGGWGQGYPDNFRFLWMPCLTLSLFLMPLVIRAVRQRARQVLSEPHIDAALARGLSQRRLIVRHVLPNSALPVVTLLGLSFGSLLSGAVVVEAVYGLPGVGSALVLAVSNRDYPVVQCVAVVSGVVVVAGNLLAEVLQRLIDPRIAW